MGLCRASASFGLLPLLVLLAACGAPPRPAEPAPTPPVASAPASAPLPPVLVSVACKARLHVCAEYQGIPSDEAAQLRQRCATEGGEALDACPADKIVGTCTASRPTMTVKQHVYRAKTGRETRGLVFDSKRACESKGGTFTAP